ncbi:MAG: lipoprotein [Candidatus Jidaibacter sp.]|jgi:predicted small lipoprotein YifL|nr:lipoprotein [Candidatus Jidaibacter sp.]
MNVILKSLLLAFSLLALTACGVKGKLEQPYEVEGTLYDR